MDNQIILPGAGEQLNHKELVRTLDLIRETNTPAYTDMRLTIARVAAVLLIQETEKAYLTEDTTQFHIFELARDHIPGFCRYLSIPGAHDARHTLMIHKGSEFAVVYVADWATGYIYTRKTLRSNRIILDLLDTFGPYLRRVGPEAGVPEGGEVNAAAS